MSRRRCFTTPNRDDWNPSVFYGELLYVGEASRRCWMSTLSCKYVICSIESRYTWSHSVAPQCRETSPPYVLSSPCYVSLVRWVFPVSIGYFIVRFDDEVYFIHETWWILLGFLVSEILNKNAFYFGSRESGLAGSGDWSICQDAASGEYFLLIEVILRGFWERIRFLGEHKRKSEFKTK